MIAINQLTRKYGDRTAVDNLSLQVHSGEVLAFLGPNGAGKTTTIKTMVGLLLPTSGSIEVCGIDVVKDPRASSRQIGYVPDQPYLYEKLSGREFLPEKNIAQLDQHTAMQAYAINAAGPMLIFQACAGLLRASAAPKALFLSAQVGSIADNQLGGWYSYRMAKAALNMGIKTAAVEASRWRNPAAVVAVHPGTTRTALSRPFIQRRRAPVRSAADSAQRIHQLMAMLTAADTGRFLTADGEPLPW